MADLTDNYLQKIISDDEKSLVSLVYTELSAKEILPVNLRVEGNVYEVFELAEKEKNLIISGASGSGKTTTLKWLNYRYADKCLKEGNCSIPLFIELKYYDKGEFGHYVKMKANEQGLVPQVYNSLLQNKNLVFLFDGLDLLSPKEGFMPYVEISNFITENCDCRFVLSGRPGSFDEFSQRQTFKISRLEELSEEEIKQFIDKYIQNDKGLSQSKKDALSKAIKDNIFKDENKKLISILGNPLLLHLAVQVALKNHNENEALPSSRYELFKKFIDGFFGHVRTRKNILANREQIIGALTDIFFKNQCRNQVHIEYESALDIANKYSEDKRFIREKISAEGIIEDIFNLGLLTSIEDGARITYGIHQSFQEYFSALKLKEWFDEGYDVSSAFSHPKWEEVVLFASEMFDRPDDFVKSMIKSGELHLASKCAQNAGCGIKEDLCIRLADKMDSRYQLEKINAIESLGRFGDIAISVIIAALSDENEDVRGSSAYALGEICTVRQKGMLYELSRSKNEFEANTAFKILTEIERNEKSKMELFKTDPDKIKEISASESMKEKHTAQSPETGKKDPYFQIPVDRLKFEEEPFVLVDYGCGQGKLFFTMNSIPAHALKNISYIGVDSSSACLLKSEFTARKLGFYEKLMCEPEFMKPGEFFKMERRIDGVYLLHTLHEIPLVELIDAIYNISIKIKKNMFIFILDPGGFIEERNYVLWDEVKDFETVFLDSGFKVYPHPITTNKGNKLNAVDVKKISEDSFSKDRAAKNCLAMYESKIAGLIEERQKEGISDKDRNDLSEVLGNLTSQKQEYTLTPRTSLSLHNSSQL